MSGITRRIQLAKERVFIVLENATRRQSIDGDETSRTCTRTEMIKQLRAASEEITEEAAMRAVQELIDEGRLEFWRYQRPVPAMVIPGPREWFEEEGLRTTESVPAPQLSKDLQAPSADDAEPVESAADEITTIQRKLEVDAETFSVRWNDGSWIELGNTHQFRLLDLLLDMEGRFVEYTTITEALGIDEFRKVAPIKSRLCTTLRDRGLDALADCIRNQPGYYGLFLQ